MRFALQFSGQEMFTQQRRAEHLLGSLSPEDHTSRARLLAVLTAARAGVDPEGAEAASNAAVLAASRTSDPVAEAWALVARAVVDLSCEATKTRRDMTARVLVIAERAREPELVTPAYFLHLAALAELGEIKELDEALSPVGPLCSTYPWLSDGRQVAWFRGLRATLDGHIDTAERLAGTAYNVAVASEDPDAESVWVGQLAVIRWMQGRVSELEPAFLTARQLAPHEPVWAVSLAWMWVQQGRMSAARALVASLPEVDQLPVDRNWLSTLCILAVVASNLRIRDLAAQIYRLLHPFEERLMTIGLGVTCWGTVARPLALLARTMGDTGQAIAHYRIAVGVAARLGAQPWLAEAQWELAEMLAENAPDEARGLASEAAATGRALRLTGIEGAAASVLARLQQGTAGDCSEGAVPGQPVVVGVQSSASIRVMGGFEVRAVTGEPVRWQSRKARQLLKILVARRGIAVARESVMHLLWPDIPVERLANRFSVALTVVRRAFDPSGELPTDTFLEHSDGLVRLKIELLDVDAETFLAAANSALMAERGDPGRRENLEMALRLHTGEALGEEHTSLWAAELQREVRSTFFAVAHACAEAAAGDSHARSDIFRSVLALDPFDQRAHRGLIEELTKLGAHGQAAECRVIYEERMASLGLPAG